MLDNFSPFLYTGQGGIGHSGVGFRPDFVWIKRRDSSSSHYIFDSVRGVGNALIPEQTYAEINNSSYLTSFDVDGFSLGTNAALSGVGRTYVAWCLKAGGSSTSSNSDGTITTNISANTEAGFNIISYAGNGTNGATIGHGLGQQVKLAFFKNRTTASTYWYVYSDGLSGSTYNLYLNDSSAETADNVMQGGNTTTIQISNSTAVNTTSNNYICYAFANIDGYQKIGTYQAVSGTLTVDVGFPIRFLMVKAIDYAGNWLMVDSARGGSSGQDRERLFANNGGAGGADTSVDFTGNTFTITSGSVGNQNTGSDYLYWAIA